MNGERGTIQTSKFGVGNTVAEAIVGLGALALAIIGLANIYPWLLASVATIALGAAFASKPVTLVGGFQCWLQRSRPRALNPGEPGAA